MQGFTLFWLFGILGVHCCHLCLEFVDFRLRNGRRGLLLPREFYPLRDGWDGIFRAHTVVGIVGHESGLFPSCMMAGIIAANDALDFPPAKAVSECAWRDAYLAHEQLIELVGGCQFFAPSSSLGFSSFGSTAGILKNSVDASITTLKAAMSC